MNVINGMPGHILLVHFIVVLAPLTAVLLIVCSLWPGARRGGAHLVWLTLALAIINAVLTPLTTRAGEWLFEYNGRANPMVPAHEELGETMIFFSAGLLIAAVCLVALHRRERKSEHTIGLPLRAGFAIIVVIVSISAMVQTYRIGDSGARIVWGNEISAK